MADDNAATCADLSTSAYVLYELEGNEVAFTAISQAAFEGFPRSRNCEPRGTCAFGPVGPRGPA